MSLLPCLQQIIERMIEVLVLVSQAQREVIPLGSVNSTVLAAVFDAAVRTRRTLALRRGTAIDEGEHERLVASQSNHILLGGFQRSAKCNVSLSIHLCTSGIMFTHFRQYSQARYLRLLFHANCADTNGFSSNTVSPSLNALVANIARP